MFTLSSDGNFARLSTYTAISPNSADPAVYTEWQFDDSEAVAGISASHIFDEPGWHRICMKSCSGITETLLCSAIPVDSYVTNTVALTQAPTTVAQGVATTDFQVCVSSVCEPPFIISLLALSTDSCGTENVPDTVWSSLIPQHTFFDPFGNEITSLTLDADPITVDGIVVGYESCGCFTFKDDLPGSVKIVANFQPLCELCRPDRPEDINKITTSRLSGAYEFFYDPTDLSYTAASAGYFASNAYPWSTNALVIAMVDKNGNSLEPLAEAINEVQATQKVNFTLFDSINRGVSGILTGFYPDGSSMVGWGFGAGGLPVPDECYTFVWDYLVAQPDTPLINPDLPFVEDLKQYHDHYNPFICEEVLAISGAAAIPPVLGNCAGYDEVVYAYRSFTGQLLRSTAFGVTNEAGTVGTTADYQSDLVPSTDLVINYHNTSVSSHSVDIVTDISQQGVTPYFNYGGTFDFSYGTVLSGASASEVLNFKPKYLYDIGVYGANFEVFNGNRDTIFDMVFKVYEDAVHVDTVSAQVVHYMTGVTQGTTDTLSTAGTDDILVAFCSGQTH